MQFSEKEFSYISIDINKSTAHGCWTLDCFVSDIKLQAIYKVIHTSNYRGGSRGAPGARPPKIEKKMIFFGVKS